MGRLGKVVQGFRSKKDIEASVMPKQAPPMTPQQRRDKVKRDAVRSPVHEDSRYS